MNLRELTALVADEAKAFELVEKLVWPNGPTCPRCGATDRLNRLGVQRSKPSKKNPEGVPVHGLWKCYHCRGQFTVRKGTIFEESHIPLSAWLIAIHMMCSSKKGVSANQLMRQLGIAYSSAWFMCHRVREIMTQSPLAEKLGGAGTSGIVEADETYLGAKGGNNLHKNYKRKPKSVVMTLVERDGRARTFPIPAPTKSLMSWPIRQNVEGTAYIVTDKHPSYVGLSQHFAGHDSVDHGKEYVRGIIHINFAESYHSLLKRGILGTFHHVSEKHLPRYLREFEFRWNTRKFSDGERTEKAVRDAVGKRLRYRMP